MIKAFTFDEVMVVGMCNVIMNLLIDNVPENKQM